MTNRRFAPISNSTRVLDGSTRTGNTSYHTVILLGGMLRAVNMLLLVNKTIKHTAVHVCCNTAVDNIDSIATWSTNWLIKSTAVSIVLQITCTAVRDFATAVAFKFVVLVVQVDCSW